MERGTVCVGEQGCGGGDWGGLLCCSRAVGRGALWGRGCRGDGRKCGVGTRKGQDLHRRVRGSRCCVRQRTCQRTPRRGRIGGAPWSTPPSTPSRRLPPPPVRSGTPRARTTYPSGPRCGPCRSDTRAGPAMGRGGRCRRAPFPMPWPSPSTPASVRHEPQAIAHASRPATRASHTVSAVLWCPGTGQQTCRLWAQGPHRGQFAMPSSRSAAERPQKTDPPLVHTRGGSEWEDRTAHRWGMGVKVPDGRRAPEYRHGHGLWVDTRWELRLAIRRWPTPIGRGNSVANFVYQPAKGRIGTQEGEGVWDSKVCVPKLAPQDSPKCTFRFARDGRFGVATNE